MISMRAPAKLNLVLEVLGRRNDGYHDISGIMQTVDLCDELNFEHAKDLVLHCTAGELETDENLVLKAARLLKEKCGYIEGAAISLIKNIPWGAGLGGGSSDAAAALLALNRLWSAGYSADELMTIASQIGSDVPFFIRGGTCLAEGRGERITLLPDMQKTWFVLIVPGMESPPGKTAAMYKMVDAALFTMGQYTAKACDELVKEKGLPGQYLYNAFDALSYKAYHGLDIYRDALNRVGAGAVHLAGSGPVLFAFVADKMRAEEMAEDLKAMKISALAVSSLGRSELEY